MVPNNCTLHLFNYIQERKQNLFPPNDVTFIENVMLTLKKLYIAKKKKIPNTLCFCLSLLTGILCNQDKTPATMFLELCLSLVTI